MATASALSSAVVPRPLQVRRKIGRRKATAKCVFCGRNHGDNAPWWNSGKNCWSITLPGKRNRMLVRGWDGHDEAIRLFLAGELPAVASRGEPGAFTVLRAEQGEQLTVREVCDAYLCSIETATTFPKVKATLNDLCQTDIGSMTVAELRVAGSGCITQWAALHNWNSSTRTTAKGRVKSAFEHLCTSIDDMPPVLQSNPLRGLNTGKNKDEMLVRAESLTAEHFAVLLSAAERSTRSPEFAVMFRLLLGSGCRPSELCRATAADVKRDSAGNVYLYVRHKNEKHTRKRRKVYLCNPFAEAWGELAAKLSMTELEKIVTEAADAHPVGPIFRNGWNRPWDSKVMAKRFRDLCKAAACKQLGLNELTNAVEIAAAKKAGLEPPKPIYSYVLYSCRHTFAVQANGVGWPIERVADLMGNSIKMQERVYGKLDSTAHNFVSQKRS